MNNNQQYIHSKSFGNKVQFLDFKGPVCLIYDEFLGQKMEHN